jgi:uncharacterized protein YhaN
MSLQIKLENFGIFKDNIFDLNKVTVFYGPNESGKTTLLDAITLGTTKFGNKTKEKSRIKKRFPEADVKVCDSEDRVVTPYIPPDVMMDLLRNKARNMNLNYSENWTQQIKEELIAGGINPKEIIDKIREEIEVSRRVGSFKRRMKDITSTLTKITEKLESNKNSWRDVLTEIGDMRGEIVNRKDLEQQKKELEQNIENIKEEYIGLKNTSDYKTYKDILGRFHKLAELEDKINNLTDYDTSKKEEIENILAKQNLLQGQIDEKTEQGILECSSADLRNKLDIVNEYESRFREGDIVSKNKSYFWNLLISIILFGLAGITWRFLPYSEADIISGVLAAAGLISLVWIGIDKYAKNSGYDFADIVNEINTKLPNEISNNIKSLSDLTVVLEKLRNKLDRSIIHNDLKMNLEESIKILKDLLPNGISAAKYLEKINTNNRAMIEYENITNELEAQRIILKGETSKMNLNDFKSDCAAKYQSLDLINHQDLPTIGSEDLTRKQNTIGKKVEALNNINNELTMLGTDIAAEEGQLSSREHEIANNIVEFEKELKRCEVEKEKLQIEERGHRKLLEILEEVSTEVETDFSSLSDEVAKSLNSILGGTVDEPIVSIKDLNNVENLEVSDARKSMRALSHLSSGTRDAFVMAARMIMAKKAVEGIKRPIFTFDDTFLFMDSNRTKNAIQFLKGLVNENQFSDDAYFVFFTKDKDTFFSIKDEFEDCTSYEL